MDKFQKQRFRKIGRFIVTAVRISDLTFIAVCFHAVQFAHCTYTSDLATNSTPVLLPLLARFPTPSGAPATERQLEEPRSLIKIKLKDMDHTGMVNSILSCSAV
jgi:hypothetical protein